MGLAGVKFTKFLILVDSHVDLSNTAAVMAEVGANVAPEHDIFFHDGPAHASDHANSLGRLARHTGIDATAKIAGERPGNWPARLAPSPEIAAQVTAGRIQARP